MNPFRLVSRVRPPPRFRKFSADRIGAAIRERAGFRRSAAGAGGDLPQRGGGAPGELSALRVPWRVRARVVPGVVEVEHCGWTPAHSVRFALAGDGMLGLSLPGTVRPGERVRIAVRGGLARDCATASDAMLVLRWFEPDGREFLWPIVLE